MIKKIFVFSYDRPDTITTSPMLESEGIDHTLLLHDNNMKKGYTMYGRVNPKRIHVTGQPKGLANNRNAALDMMKEGEWALFFVDDLIRLSEYKDYDKFSGSVKDLDINFKNQRKWNKLFKNEVPLSRLLKRANEDIKIAEKHGFHLIGFSLHENTAYRGVHYKTWCLADGRCWVVKKGKLRFDLNTQLIDDTSFTVLNLKEYGGVLVNQWVLPECKRYTKGAYGTKGQRMEQKLKEAQYLVESHPEHIGFANKKGWPENSHVRIKTNRKAIKI